MLRFAPSPTGSMHIGNLRVALFNFVVARQLQQPLMVRIEDTDLERNIPGKDQEILKILESMGISWDHLVYQSANLPTHLEYAQKLLDHGEAFYCHCTPAFLETKKQEALQANKPFRYEDSWALIEQKSNPHPVVRLKGGTQRLQFQDVIKGALSFDPFELDSFVILRSNKTPTYNFACACDDLTYKISYIIRGEDHVSNTPKQILIQQALRRTLNLSPQNLLYAHLPILLNFDDGKKMSKRNAASSVEWLIQEGFLPQSIANYLLSLGYNPPSELFSLQEATQWLQMERVSPAGARFDLAYLRHLNHRHLECLSLEELSALLKLDHPQKAQLARLFLQECSTLAELQAKLHALFAPKDINQQEGDRDFKQQALQLFSVLKSMPICENFTEFKQLAMAKSQLKGKDFFKPLRLLLTGELHGVELALLYPHLKPFLEQILVLKGDHGC
ncbi:Glutamylglutaminyl-tRNA synthetase GltX [Helicobacter bizzozeronii]|uniref:glutamate--tRNA ligase n=1 Tax=Helicobacter bizzozeronii TaxID=56877 RepID=UPI00244D930C|nr:glutamate--tRNA ligase [Helicobacter bizzozeronii]GMB93562.1 Glutamylglutaminyl-tRNA synthetase GltX [Helicobacter bizzozeronii]